MKRQKQQIAKAIEQETKALIDGDPFLQDIESIRTADLSPHERLEMQLAAIFRNYQSKTGDAPDAALMAQVMGSVSKVS